MELQQYLGDKISRKIIEEATLETKEFKTQNPGTQLQLAVSNAHELHLLRKSIPYLLQFADEQAADFENLEADNKLLEEENNELKVKFNYVNPTYIERRAALSQEITPVKLHLKRAFHKFVTRHEND